MTAFCEMDFYENTDNLKNTRAPTEHGDFLENGNTLKNTEFLL